MARTRVGLTYVATGFFALLAIQMFLLVYSLSHPNLPKLWCYAIDDLPVAIWLSLLFIFQLPLYAIFGHSTSYTLTYVSAGLIFAAFDLLIFAPLAIYLKTRLSFLLYGSILVAAAYSISIVADADILRFPGHRLPQEVEIPNWQGATLIQSPDGRTLVALVRDRNGNLLPADSQLGGQRTLREVRLVALNGDAQSGTLLYDTGNGVAGIAFTTTQTRDPSGKKTNTPILIDGTSVDIIEGWKKLRAIDKRFVLYE
jgi:hypothetical protein